MLDSFGRSVSVCRTRGPFIALSCERSNELRPARGKTGRPAAPVASSAAPETSLADLPNVGPQRAKLLAKLGLVSIEDALVRHLPTRHEDRSQILPLGRITVGEARTCAGTIAGISPPPRRRGRMPLVVTIRDATGFLNCAWFNQAYLARVFKRGQRLIVHGKVQPYGRGPLQMLVKDYELVEDGEDEPLHAAPRARLPADRGAGAAAASPAH